MSVAFVVGDWISGLGIDDWVGIVMQAHGRRRWDCCMLWDWRYNRDKMDRIIVMVRWGRVVQRLHALPRKLLARQEDVGSIPAGLTSNHYVYLRYNFRRSTPLSYSYKRSCK